MKGYLHIYTGNGKGKTTAAFGVALRSIFSGKRVYVAQFIKDMKYSETELTKHFDNITIEQLGCGCIINREANEEDKMLAQRGLSKVKEILTCSNYDLVILDELTIALYLKLLDLDEVMNVLKNRLENIEVIVTGRYAPKELIEMADLVTEMKEIKHYYRKGVLSRKGIDC